MRRLVYSPKVQAYVRTDAGIVDVSPYVTAGSVTRVINDVSSAELTLRNPNKKFTTPGLPTFRPMDGITIYLSRYANYPVQVFTGYLDQTPYLQLFPGTCTIKASCTLKRLLHTYFDPGIPYTHSFLKSYGWLPNFQDGTVTNLEELTSGPSTTVSPFEEIDEPLTDGSIGNLIYATLEQIGNWKRDQIYIEELPPGLIKSIQEIFARLQKDDEEMRTEFDTFLAKIIGASGGGSGGPNAGAGDNELTGGSLASIKSLPPALQQYNAHQAALLAEAAGFPGDPAFWGKVAMCESGGDPKVVSFTGCCSGIWQVNWRDAHGGRKIPGAGGATVSKQTMEHPHYNALFSAYLARDQGSGPWVASQDCWG